jgi:hypothetical protein
MKNGPGFSRWGSTMQLEMTFFRNPFSRAAQA